MADTSPSNGNTIPGLEETETKEESPTEAKLSEKIETEEKKDSGNTAGALQLEGDPEETATWTKFIKTAKDEADIEIKRAGYERFLHRFPFSSKHWIEYMEIELKALNFDHVENILKRTLLSCSSMVLWEYYLKYTKEKLEKEKEANKVSKSESEEELTMQHQEKLREAYDFVLENIGFAISSRKLWKDYIAFLGTMRAETQYEAGQRMTALRKTYQKAVATPIHGVEELWREYQQFENQLGKATADKLIKENKQKHDEAVAIYKERKSRWAGVRSETLPERFKGTDKEKSQLNKWKALIEYELSNPEKVSASLLKKRVRFVYTQALSVLQFYPEIWYDFSMFEASGNDPMSAEAVFDRALSTLPYCMLLSFAACDTYERHGNFNKARNIYEGLLKTVAKDESPNKGERLTSVYVQYQRFLRRVDGINAARQLFKRARMHGNLSYKMYVASAEMEYRVNKEEEVAFRIFELGLNKYKNNAKFALKYIEFIRFTNSSHKLLNFFERTVSNLDAKDAYPIYQEYRKFCSEEVANGGDLALLEKVEKRMREVYPEKENLHGLLSIADRYSSEGLVLDSLDDSAFFSRNMKAALQPVVSSAINTTSSSMPAQEVNENTVQLQNAPEFLHKLISALPNTFRATGSQVVDVINRIQLLQLPPRPTSKALPSSGFKNNQGGGQGGSIDIYANRHRKKQRN
mmetsp:Transcript_5450/g.7210  ORF Transcript_5450/g.7210 Transcript_5450/m.7210 type:complete len:693 (+) Transcript_5450:163-2241(+)